MSWSRFDDLYDEHDKVEDAWEQDRATVGLHVMATTHCNRLSTDGVVRPRWLRRKLPTEKERSRVLAVMVEVGLFDLLPAGEIVTVRDSDGEAITLGPFAEDRHIVHDFLLRHDSSRQVKERRKADAVRKAASRRRGRRAESERSPEDVRADSGRTPGGVQPESGASRTCGRAGAQAFPDPALPDPALKTGVGGGSDVEDFREPPPLRRVA